MLLAFKTNEFIGEYVVKYSSILLFLKGFRHQRFLKT